MIWHKNLQASVILQLLLLEEILVDLTLGSWAKVKLYIVWKMFTWMNNHDYKKYLL